MANKNTKRARKKGLSNMPETTLGTGEHRKIIERRADPVFKGSTCDTGWDNPNSKRQSRKRYSF